MLAPESRYLDQLRRLNVNRSGERRAPHKPLLLLVAISRLLEGKADLTFGEVESALDPLLRAYAPPVKSRHQPELPYWHLQGDGLWQVDDAVVLPRQAGGFPRMAPLRKTSGHLEPGFADGLRSDRGFLECVVQMLLDEHFPESVHEDILDAVGLHLPEPEVVADANVVLGLPHRRSPEFRRRVLRAYEHRCAVTGFRLALGGQYFGCEAAHVRWRAYGGPDSVDNGFAAEPTIHKLFDAGAWTLTDDRRILVSAELTGSDDTVAAIRSFHGRPLRRPLAGEPEVSVEYIRWHRDPDRGGVFRAPALNT